MAKSLLYPFDAANLLKNKKRIIKSYKSDGKPRIEKKIAFLCGSTANDIKDVCSIFLLDDMISPEFYLSEYGMYWEEAVFGGGVDSFSPDVIYIYTTTRNIEKFFPEPGCSEDDANRLFDEAKHHFFTMWEKLREKHSCPIIQNNFELPRYRLLGNRDAFDPRGGVAFVNRLNAFVSDYAREREGFYINDIAYVSACYGLDKWSDQSAWYMYKYALAIEAIPSLAFNLAGIIKSIFGKSKKALSLDLDNTLWGGVVGEDGVENLSLGEETPLAQAYLDFQKYLLKVKNTGVMLTVNSKNDHQNALAGLNHRDSALRPEDFIVIKANWEPKNQNLIETAEKLNIGVDSFVFVDDNPAERHIVEGTLPVAAPEIGEVEDYIRILDRNNFFETTSLTAEDIGRSEMYKANIQREISQSAFESYDDYLYSLGMTAEIKRFIPEYIRRIAQLTNKSNQFNLTTRRYTVPEIESIAGDIQYIPLYGKLTDRFGDNGVVSVVIGRKEGKALHIDLWIMSCRVLKRDMEFAMLDRLAETASAEGIKEIYGYYLPTQKNSMVKDLFVDFGFFKIDEDDSGNTKWFLKTDGYKKKNRFIDVL